MLLSKRRVSNVQSSLGTKQVSWSGRFPWRHHSTTTLRRRHRLLPDQVGDLGDATMTCSDTIRMVQARARSMSERRVITRRPVSLFSHPPAACVWVRLRPRRAKRQRGCPSSIGRRAGSASKSHREADSLGRTGGAHSSVQECLRPSNGSMPLGPALLRSLSCAITHAQ